MKYTLIIEEHTYEVEIENLHTRPILARVNGEVVEVWTGMKPGVAVSSAEKPQAKQPAVRSAQPDASSAAGKSEADHATIRSPIPGTIISVSVKPGDEVLAGQELCVLEAMKMKNQIRAPRPGTIAIVHVAAGQTVQHHDMLMEYEK